jgi:AraC-like DNA-binding protein
MPTNGTTIFYERDDFQTGFRGAAINLVIIGPGKFTARLTSVNLPHLRLFVVEESLPRIAYAALPAKAVNVGFPLRFQQSSIWGGIETNSRDLIFHAAGERMHQRTCGAGTWGNIAVDPEFFAYTSKALTGSQIIPPRIGKSLRPSHADRVELQRQHARLCRLVETKPLSITHTEVARAIEHDFMYALIRCLTADVVHGNTGLRRRHSTVMNRLEKVLAEKFDRQLPMPELCKATGVSERTLRACCAVFLGMSPSYYMRLRRLNLMHTALAHADPAATSISEIASRYGFTELGRLAGVYRTIFGAMPSETLGSSLITGA